MELLVPPLHQPWVLLGFFKYEKEQIAKICITSHVNAVLY